MKAVQKQVGAATEDVVVTEDGAVIVDDVVTDEGEVIAISEAVVEDEEE